jgi:hypothetical protein
MAKDTVAISWDWKEQPEIGDLKTVAKFFGGHVYEDPTFEGSDMYGFIFSKEPLNKKDLEQIAEDNNS